MDKRLREMLEGREGIYVFPFLWLHEGGRDQLPGRIQTVFDSGCRELCVESRPHEQFCRQGWWEDMEVVLSEAEKLGMGVWILDDKHFPTGYANGILKEKYPGRRHWFLREHHVDVVGPMRGASVLVPFLNEEEDEQLLGAVAFRRGNSGELLAGEGMLLEDMEQGFLYWDVPEGFYRIFFLIKTRQGYAWDHRDYISGIEADSVQALIEAVYEPHYAHFSRYFGNTLRGFFSDEPGFTAQHIGPWGQDAGMYQRTIGQPGMALPWSDEVIGRMALESEGPAGAEDWGERDDLAVIRRLPGLWYPMEMGTPEIRLAYMNVITSLWEQNFSWQIGDWCRAHGVSYTGHVIEDMNADMRLGSSAGHYFRALGGQDMSGIDVVLHQVLPGFAEHDVAALTGNGRTGNEFFHYVLPKLGVSLARIRPKMQGRAMCEVFGAYGWAGSASCMKWLIDFLLVRGVTRFVPHGFTDHFPDPDCPPHFYAQGNNPQFEGFSRLMGYANRMSHLLEGAELWADGAILYMAEAEWMSTPAYRTLDGVAKILYDAHIDFDILPLDGLEEAKVQDGKLMVNGHAHRFLVIPYAEHYPKRLHRLAEYFVQEGLPVFWLLEEGTQEGRWPSEEGAWEGRRPSEGGTRPPEDGIRKRIWQEELVPVIRKRKLAYWYGDVASHLRIGQFRRGTAAWFLLFWEDVQRSLEETVTLPCQGEFLRLDLLNGRISRDFTEDGRVTVRLTPYQSQLLLFDELPRELVGALPKKERWEEPKEPQLLWEIALLEQGKEEEFSKVREASELFSITGRDGWPRFSGRMRYRTTLFLETGEDVGIDLGAVGVTAKLTVNEQELGMRICPPYRWDISDAARQGSNLIEVEAANTLVHRLQDRFSQYMQISPSGLLGPVRVYRIRR